MPYTINSNNDLRVGDVLTVRNGTKYAVVADDNGHHDVINLTDGKSNGIEVGTERLAVCGSNGKNGREVVSVHRFDAVPARNRLSEALKFMTGRRFTEPMHVIWEAKDPRIAAAEQAVAAAEAAMRDAQEKLMRAQRQYS